MIPSRDIDNNSFSKLYQNKVFFYFVLILGTLLLVLKLPMAQVYYETVSLLITFAPMVVIIIMAAIAYIKSQRYPDYQSIIRKFYLLFTLKFLSVIFVFYVFYSPSVFLTPILAFVHYFKTFLTLEAVFFALSYLLTGVIALSFIFVCFRAYQKSQGKYLGSIRLLTKRTLYAVFAFCFLILASSAAAYPQSYKPLTDTLGDAIYTLSAGNIQVLKGADPVAYTKIKSLKEFTDNLSDSLAQTSQNIVASNQDFQDSLDAANTELKESIKQTSKDLNAKIKDDLAGKVSVDGGEIEGDLLLIGNTADLSVGGTIDTGQGATEIFLQDQNLRTTDAPTFATLNTGQGSYELYAMDQDVLIASAPTFGGLTLNGNLVLGANTLTTSNATVVTNLNADLLDARHESEFALLAGRSGGQILIGGTGSGDNLTLQSTSHSTKGKILFGTSAYDEVNNRLGIGTASPGYTIDVSSGSINAGSYTLGGITALSTASTNTLLRASSGFGVAFAVNGASTLATSSMYINSSGNVGIGTTSPSYRLDVKGTTVAHGIRSDMGFDMNPVVKPTFVTGNLALTAGGSNLGIGTYVYTVTFTTALGETDTSWTAASPATITTDSSNRKVTITVPTSTDPRVTGRKIYRTTVGGAVSANKLLTTIANNTTTTYVDDIADGSLTGSTDYFRSNTTSNYVSVNGSPAFSLTPNTNANTFFGYSVGNSTLSSGRNVAFGSSMMGNLTSGSSNVAVGNFSQTLVTSGSQNISMGYGAASQLTTGASNVAIGHDANFYNKTGSENTALGDFALFGALNNSYSYNTAIGKNAGYSVTTGGSNTYLGAYAGFTNTTGTGNVFLGFYAGKYETGSQKIIIDNLNRTNEATQRTDALIYGVTNATPTSQILSLGGGGNVGIGTTSPNNLLQVAGLINFSNAAFGTFLGYNAGSVNTGAQNTFVGYQSGINNTTGSSNTIMGFNAGYYGQGSVGNTLIGVQAGRNNTGQGNTFVGLEAGDGNTSGGGNTFIGANAGELNTVGYYNTMQGGEAGYYKQTGNNNVFLGYRAGRGTATYTAAANNIMIGFESGYNSTTNTSGNVFLGYQAGYNETGSNKLYIENSNSSLPLIYGDFSSNILSFNGNVGIGDTTPDTTLKVVGSICAKADETDCFGATAGNIYAANFIVDGTTHLPDYVFANDYPLMSLNDLKNYINLNQHLPGVPSANEVSANGLNLSTMVPAILEKTEENTLYILQNNEQLNQQGTQTGVQTQLIASLQLKTDQNITTIQQLQTSVDTQLGVVGASINTINAEMAVQTQGIASLQTGMVNLDGQIVAQTQLIASLQAQIEELKTQIATPVDVAQIELNKNDIAYLNQLLGIDVTKPGDIALLGALTAKKVVVDGVETGAITIMVINKDAATIGEAIIKAGETAVIVKTTAVSADSKVFVTAEHPVEIGVNNIKDGESFQIEVGAVAPADLNLNWWIVEKK
ncbi:MAG: hypothetical protein WC238_02065 [Parcubacteria group bacterium]|jgi:hypothetical protein